ncbi:MAG: hypothetical protein K2X01_10580 [Cyanobacteria bacterium]|nr:hypothetical protein [Cyanobacteriota bacterium]
MNPLLFSNYQLFSPWQSRNPLDMDFTLMDSSSSSWDDTLAEGNQGSGLNQIFSSPLFSSNFLPSFFTNTSDTADSELIGNQPFGNAFTSNTFSPLSQMFSGFDFSLLSTPLNSQNVATPAARNTTTNQATHNSLTDLLNTSQQDSVYSSLLTSFTDLFNTVNQIAALKK